MCVYFCCCCCGLGGFVCLFVCFLGFVFSLWGLGGFVLFLVFLEFGVFLVCLFGEGFFFLL